MINNTSLVGYPWMERAIDRSEYPVSCLAWLVYLTQWNTVLSRHGIKCCLYKTPCITCQCRSYTTNVLETADIGHWWDLNIISMLTRQAMSQHVHVGKVGYSGGGDYGTSVVRLSPSPWLQGCFTSITGYTVRGKSIRSPADFVHFPADKEMISL